MKKVLTLVVGLLGLGFILRAQTANVPVHVQGLEQGDTAIVTLGSETYLQAKTIVADGEVTFNNVTPGTHYAKVEITGYAVPASKIITVKEDGSVVPVETVRLVITKQEGDPNTWTHSWEEDGSVSGHVTTAYVNKPAEKEWLGRRIVPSDVSFFEQLKTDQYIILADDEEPWTQEYAYRLVETIKTIPCSWNLNGGYVKFTLTAESINDDIVVTDVDGNNKEVRISKDAFYYANPFLVSLDGVRGRYFSKRLHHALVNYITNFGNDSYKVNKILKDRFGCQVLNVNYTELTKGITDEDATYFQAFTPSELVSIINTLEELPEGFHSTDHLNYLIRRQNGHDHPLYPDAAAVSWCIENGYIEFMEKAFGGNNLDFETLRLILHEKTHFLWKFSFSDEIKNDWIELGGWYEDPNAPDGWSTTKNTEFVSAYAHAHNPNEDMAESVAFYLKNPDMLMSRSLPKYEFIRDRIMHGTRYISKIPDHLTFEVLNLFPDYDYPGKINHLEVSVKGSPEADKTISVEVWLNNEEGYDDGASKAFLRMTSPTWLGEDGKRHSQIRDLYLYPVGGDNHHLKGSLTMSKYSKAGNWTVGDIKVTDLVGNQRFEGQHDVVWNCYVNNALEDLTPPKYIDNSLEYELEEAELDGHSVQYLKVKFKFIDDVGIAKTYARVRIKDNTGYFSSLDEYGTYNAADSTATVTFRITEFFPSGDYYATYVEAADYANTYSKTDFYESNVVNPVKYIHITTSNPDVQAPEVDLNRMVVYAEPTHPEAPDGETKVTITYYCRDDKSGLGRGVSYRLRDPQGIDHFEYHYHRNYYTNYFDGDPTVWEKYIINVVLPKGSAPGIWGLSQLTVQDKAMNGRTYNFVETMIFEPDDSNEGYELFAELNSDNETLELKMESDDTDFDHFDYRIINEENGREISNTVSKRAKAAENVNVNISELGYGRIIVFAYAKDAGGSTLSVKNKIIERTEIANTEVPAETITLNKTEVELFVGGADTLTATILPENTTDTLMWSSSKTDIATVSADGIITAIAMGTATITAKCGNVSASCEITVRMEVEEVKDTTYTITVVVKDNVGGSVTGGGTFKKDTTVTITATAAEGYKFVEWEEDGVTDAERTVKVVRDATYTAVFEKLENVANETAAALTVRAYPNPSTGLFTVEVGCGATAELYAASGLVLGRYAWKTAGKYAVDLRGRVAGVYYLRLTADNSVKTVKLVVR